MSSPAKNQPQIRALYRKAGMKPPVGKGEHTMTFHRMVASIGEDGKNPYAIAMAKLGPEKAVQKSHRKEEQARRGLRRMAKHGK